MKTAEEIVIQLAKYYEKHQCSDCDCPIIWAQQYVEEKAKVADSNAIDAFLAKGSTRAD